MDLAWLSEQRGDRQTLQLGTFVSVPVLGGAGEMIGTLCAVGRERRFLSDPVLQHVQALSQRIAPLVQRAG